MPQPRVRRPPTALCGICKRPIGLTPGGVFLSHYKPNGIPCPGSATRPAPPAPKGAP